MSGEARWLRLLSLGGAGLAVEADRFPRCVFPRSCVPRLTHGPIAHPHLSRDGAIGALPRAASSQEDALRNGRRLEEDIKFANANSEWLQ
jgi:hypothetical protein